MPERWLQIKGDAAIRAQLFEQRRTESLFDTALDRVHEVVHTLLTCKGAFHTKIHYSSNQLTCWFASDPFCYEKFVREEVLADTFVERFPDSDHAGRTPVITGPGVLRSQSMHWRMIRFDCRISATRTR